MPGVLARIDGALGRLRLGEENVSPRRGDAGDEVGRTLAPGILEDAESAGQFQKVDLVGPQRDGQIGVRRDRLDAEPASDLGDR